MSDSEPETLVKGISGLPRIAHVSFYDRLENWWKAKTTPAALLSLTVRICRLLHSDQQSYQALRAEFLSQESARIVPAPTLREDLHALFPAISSDEAPGAEPEEVFRASHKNCMEAFEERSMPPLKRPLGTEKLFQQQTDPQALESYALIRGDFSSDKEHSSKEHDHHQDILSSPESGIQVTKASTQAHVRHEKPLDITNNVICTNPHVSHLQESSEIAEKENQLQAAGPTHDDTQSPIVLETSDVPGLHLYLNSTSINSSVGFSDFNQLLPRTIKSQGYLNVSRTTESVAPR
ncbi:hypothetical protein N7453_009660 [Penicillium expansum]|nr:hypothetical protein N7453_009660 [Penicillium expansum]